MTKGQVPPEPLSSTSSPAASVLAVSVEPLGEGFLRASLGWLIRGVAAMGLGMDSEASASLRVRRRSDNRIVYEQTYRATYSNALAVKQTVEADLQRLSLTEFLSEYDIPEASVVAPD